MDVAIGLAIQVGLNMIKSAQDAIAAGQTVVPAEEVKRHLALLDSASAENAEWQRQLGASGITGQSTGS
jgi:hypothetical protein